MSLRLHRNGKPALRIYVSAIRHRCKVGYTHVWVFHLRDFGPIRFAFRWVPIAEARRLLYVEQAHFLAALTEDRPDRGGLSEHVEPQLRMPSDKPIWIDLFSDSLDKDCAYGLTLVLRDLARSLADAPKRHRRGEGEQILGL